MLITIPGLIDIDFADVRAIMSEGGAALMAVGTGSGDERAKKAAEAAISSALLDVTIDGARGVLFNVTGGPSMTLFEINQAAAIIRETVHPDVNTIFGAVIDPNMGDEIRITIIATGFDRSNVPQRSYALGYPRQSTEIKSAGIKIEAGKPLKDYVERSKLDDPPSSVERPK